MEKLSLINLSFIIILIWTNVSIIKVKSARNIAPKSEDTLDFPQASSLASLPVQCEPNTTPLCTKMPYRFTRMPNFFKDSTQFDVNERALSYQDLVDTHCSPYVHDYVCELIAPVCMADKPEVMRQYEIYPCRSFCRQVRQDCALELDRMTQLLAAFSCDQLPYERNGGLRNLEGPCRENPLINETTTASPQQSGQNSINRAIYKPFEPNIDSNIPPFITDTSAIDAAHIKPAPSPDFPHPKIPPQQVNLNNNNNSISSQIQTFVQSITWALVKYSNILSILTVICLLLALNSNRIRRLKNYLINSSSSSSSSATSGSSASCRFGRHFKSSKSNCGVLGQIGAGGAGDVHHHHITSSPSSSARSLVLIAGNNKSQPSHQLIANNQIAANLGLSETLERQRLKGPTRYHLSAGPFNNSSSQLISGDKQQLFSSTLDSQSSSNQYDYIQVQRQPPNCQATQHYQSNRSNKFQQQQLYSNILLSSPSHQVLLAGNGSIQSAGQAGRIQQPTVNSRHPYNRQTNSLINNYEQRSFQRKHSHSSCNSPGRSFARASCSSSSSQSSASVSRSPPDLQRRV